ncbi:unnamed protein product [Tenebrio molitor]|jgi:hypothetical protein|nr:unnamed protein product [Tenebrio molitor]
MIRHSCYFESVYLIVLIGHMVLFWVMGETILDKNRI